MYTGRSSDGRIYHHNRVGSGGKRREERMGGGFTVDAPQSAEKRRRLELTELYCK